MSALVHFQLILIFIYMSIVANNQLKLESKSNNFRLISSCTSTYYMYMSHNNDQKLISFPFDNNLLASLTTPRTHKILSDYHGNTIIEIATFLCIHIVQVTALILYHFYCIKSYIINICQQSHRRRRCPYKHKHTHTFTSKVT